MHDRADNLRPTDAKRLDVASVRSDFPILSTEMNGRPLVYFDNGATTQKPRSVIDAITHYYEHDNANIHRGVYSLSQRATSAVEDARLKVARFLGASEPAECLFVRGVTEAINLVAMSWARTHLKQGDEIVLTALEHHSNIVPWQLAAEAVGAKVRTLPMNERGELDYEQIDSVITEKTKFVAMGHVSNALGTIHDVDRVVKAAKKVGAVVLIDGAQHVGHLPTNVKAIGEGGCDFYCFSAHKLFGPTGVGVLWGRRDLLEKMPPFMGGGDMIESVTWERTTYAPIPAKFEAGTPDIAGIIGMGAAIDYVERLGWEAIAEQETLLLRHATQRLETIPGLRIIGTAEHKAGVVSFILEDPPVSSLDIGMKLDAEGIAVRTGHHCAQPLMVAFGIPGTTRASFAFYNTIEEVDKLAGALEDIVKEAASRARHAPAETTELKWPEPAAASPEEAAGLLIEDFAFLKEAGEDPRDFILDLGRNLPFMPADQKNEATHVKGCMSQVWLTARRRPGTKDALDFIADSDAEIVKGLIGVLQHVFSGQSAAKITAFDVENLLRKLDFQNLISVQRRSGVEAMINRIKSLAAATVKNA